MSIRCEDIFSHPEFRRLSACPASRSTCATRACATSSAATSTARSIAPGCIARPRQAWSSAVGAARRRRAGPSPARARRAAAAPRPDASCGTSSTAPGLRQYVADPARGSIHSFGMAIDATLIDAEGRELDMGSGFDEMTELLASEARGAPPRQRRADAAQHRQRASCCAARSAPAAFAASRTSGGTSRCSTGSTCASTSLESIDANSHDRANSKAAPSSSTATGGRSPKARSRCSTGASPARMRPTTSPASGTAPSSASTTTSTASSPAWPSCA